jgi:hypothetical protein
VAGLRGLSHLAERVDVENRGEVVFTNDQFDQANRLRTAHGATSFADSPALCGPITDSEDLAAGSTGPRPGSSRTTAS